MMKQMTNWYVYAFALQQRRSSWSQSEEDKKLKEDLELGVHRVCNLNESDGVHELALELLRNEIRTATSSMTSVPKPLKFLRPFYDELKQAYEVG